VGKTRAEKSSEERKRSEKESIGQEYRAVEERQTR